MKAQRIGRLEQALMVWEDVSYIISKLYKDAAFGAREMLGLTRNEGPLVHHMDLRQHIIKNALKGDFNYNKFIYSETTKGILQETGSVPKHLFAWNHFSRKTFRLDKDLQALLSATTLDGIYYGEIKWPFESFVLILDDPISDGNGRLFDCIVFSEVGEIDNHPQKDDYKIFDTLILSTELEQYRPLDRKKLEKSFSKNKWNYEKMARKATHIGRHYMESFFTYIHNDPEKDKLAGSPLKESIEKYRSQTSSNRGAYFREALGVEPLDIIDDEYGSYGLCDKAKHLIISTCLYLSTLATKNFLGVQQEKNKEPFKIDLASIVSANDIFHIQCESTLSKENQDAIFAINEARISSQKRPHWRRGHWRRQPSNEISSRIWIRPCFVNKHLVPKKSLPVASKTTLE